MALITCKECKKQVSTTAKTCPNCGAKVKKPVGVIGIIFAGIFGLSVYQCSSTAEHISSNSAAREAAKTPAQKSAEAADRAADSRRFDIAFDVAKHIKTNAKDPSSVKFAQIGVSGDGTIVCATYRAKNSFNATVPGVAVLFKGTIYTDSAKWNKHCSNSAALNDYTAAGG